MKNILTLFAVAVMTFGLIGCSKTDIDIVKNGTLSRYPDKTIGEAIANYSHFTDKKWINPKSATGSRAVYFHSKLKVSAEATQKGITEPRLSIGFSIQDDGRFAISMVNIVYTENGNIETAYPDQRTNIATLDMIYGNKPFAPEMFTKVP